MFIVHVTCSDEACAEEIEAVVQKLDEADDLVCECGHGTVLISVAELDAAAPVIAVQFGLEPPRLAA